MAGRSLEPMTRRRWELLGCPIHPRVFSILFLTIRERIRKEGSCERNESKGCGYERGDDLNQKERHHALPSIVLRIIFWMTDNANSPFIQLF